MNKHLLTKNIHVKHQIRHYIFKKLTLSPTIPKSKILQNLEKITYLKSIRSQNQDLLYRYSSIFHRLEYSKRATMPPKITFQII